MNTGKNIKHWQKQGLPVMFHTGVAPPFDVFSLSRSLRPFYRDLFEMPDKVKKAVDVGTEAMIKLGISQRQAGQGQPRGHLRHALECQLHLAQDLRRDLVPLDQADGGGLSRAGLVSVLHCDGNWDLMIPRFRELPRASCVVELDGASDIRKAREVLADHLCIKGDVRAALLALGEKEAGGDLLPGADRFHGARRGIHPRLWVRGAHHGEGRERRRLIAAARR